MRARRTLRAPAAAQLAVAATILALPATAFAVTESGSGSTATHTSTVTTNTPGGASVVTATATTAAKRSAPERPSIVLRRAHTALALNATRATALVGSATRIRGRLHPDLAGRRVVLEVRDGHRWVPTSAARTSRSGHFVLHYRVPASGTEHVRVLFRGDRAAAKSYSPEATVTGLHYAEVSWYNDWTGQTACGFHATYGVASRTLPCGTHVTFSYGGRTVNATVDDRGPFVYSRLYDLNQNVARALGMGGVASVLASV